MNTNTSNKIWTVSESLENNTFQFGETIYVRGKISNIKQGNEKQGWLFNLIDQKDSSKEIKCILYPKNRPEYNEFQKTHAFLQGSDSHYYIFTENNNTLIFPFPIKDNSLIRLKAQIQKNRFNLNTTELAIQNVEKFKVAFITVEKCAAHRDIEHVLNSLSDLVEIKGFFLEEIKELAKDVKKLCDAQCEKIEEASNESDYILFCRGGEHKIDTKFKTLSNTWEVFNEPKLKETIQKARDKGVIFISGLGHAKPQKSLADEVSNISTSTPTMAAIEAACLLLFRKTWAEYMTSQKLNLPR